MKIAYIDDPKLSKKNLELLGTINTIIEEYRQQGYRLTLRQLYYQLVSRDVIANRQQEYAKLSSLLTKGRMAGIVDWDAIEDRLRVPDKPPSWESPADIMESVINQYRRDRFHGQNAHIEVWCEKDALSGVLKRITHKYGIALMVNRGYSSTSAMHDSYQRFIEAWDAGKKVIILYLGDHDPSGIDMVRDIKKRIETFAEGAERYEDYETLCQVRRIGLTMAQIKQFNPPPNPTKLSDPRAKWYIEEYGNTCWEVDALNPETLHKLVETNVGLHLDQRLYEEQLAKEEEDKEELKKAKKSLERDDESDDYEDGDTQD